MNTYITLQFSSYQQHTVDISIVLILTEMGNNARARSSLSSPANVSVMSQHWFSLRLVAYPAPSHYLAQLNPDEQIDVKL